MSPEGTAENCVGKIGIKRHSVVPSGLCDIVFASIPSDESLGYFQMSLWDKPCENQRSLQMFLKLKATLRKRRFDPFPPFTISKK